MVECTAARLRDEGTPIFKTCDTSVGAVLGHKSGGPVETEGSKQHGQCYPRVISKVPKGIHIWHLYV